MDALCLLLMPHLRSYVPQDRAKIADFGLTLETAELLRTSAEVRVEAGSRSGGRESVAQSVPLDAKNVRASVTLWPVL